LTHFFPVPEACEANHLSSIAMQPIVALVAYFHRATISMNGANRHDYLPRKYVELEFEIEKPFLRYQCVVSQGELAYYLVANASMHGSDKWRLLGLAGDLDKFPRTQNALRRIALVCIELLLENIQVHHRNVPALGTFVPNENC
jgi:hypothetical protein